MLLGKERQKRKLSCKMRESGADKQEKNPASKDVFVAEAHCKEGQVGYLVDHDLRSLGQEVPVHAPGTG